MRTDILGSPIRIGSRTVKNRIVVPPMADFGMTDENGLVNDRHVDRYASYAKGGAGLIIIEACSAVKFQENRGTILLDSEKCLPGLGDLAKVSKQNNAVALVQIMLTGLSVMPERIIAEISEEKFQEYKFALIQAAVYCKKAGFDGIELHAAHGMYINEVIETSTRTDGYGGSFENRVRLLMELIHEIRVQCDSDFIIAVRLGNHSIEELIATSTEAEKAGADLLDISSGMGKYQETPQHFPYDDKIYAASKVKQQVNIPVICVGNITTGEMAEEILRSGFADMTAVGRGHLCDPDWANKAVRGEEPTKCRNCRVCQWYVDGRRCPAARMGRKEAER